MNRRLACFAFSNRFISIALVARFKLRLFLRDQFFDDLTAIGDFHRSTTLASEGCFE